MEVSKTNCLEQQSSVSSDKLQKNSNQLKIITLPKTNDIIKKVNAQPKAIANTKLPTDPTLRWTNLKTNKKQTPMATLEMVLTTKEFQKIQQLPKLPTNKKESVTMDNSALLTTNINLPKPLPKCITVKPANIWKTQVENLRKTVEEKLKESHQNEVKENVQQIKNYTKPISPYLTTLTCVTEATQTGSKDYETCGFVQRSIKSKRFSLTCFKCTAEYELSDWKEYLVHLNNVHKFERKTNNRKYRTDNHVIIEQTLQPKSENYAETIKEEASLTVNYENSMSFEEFDVINENNDDEVHDDRASISSWNNDDSTTQNAAVTDFYKTEHKYKKRKTGCISYVCSCGLHFADAKGKETHEATHNTEPNFTCEHCGLSFFSKKKVENHIILNHPDVVSIKKRYQCPKCDEAFAKHYMLKWHILKHDPPRYKCETCGKSFRKGFTYKIHIKRHLDQRDFICEECGKGFIAKAALKKHRFKVHKAGEHVCLPCKTYFVSNENLHEHMQKFHPNGTDLDRWKKQHARHVKKYQQGLKAKRPGGPGRRPPELKCKQCGMEFGRVGKLRQHKREFKHFLGDRRYQCPHCNSILNSDQTFVMHLRKIHELPAKYSDIKYFQPYADDDSEEKIEIAAEDLEVQVEYVNDYEDVKYAVHNMNFTNNECDSKKSIHSDVANYEEVQYSITSDEEKFKYFEIIKD